MSFGNVPEICTAKGLGFFRLSVLKNTMLIAASSEVDMASKYQKSNEVLFAAVVILKPSRFPATENFSMEILPLRNVGGTWTVDPRVMEERSPTTAPYLSFAMIEKKFATIGVFE